MRRKSNVSVTPGMLCTVMEAGDLCFPYGPVAVYLDILLGCILKLKQKVFIV